jgi:hypothetical protein
LLETGDGLRFDFETWLMQVYDLRPKMLTEKELALAKKEYAEEYPPVGESNISLKTYPFKRYLDSKR